MSFFLQSAAKKSGVKTTTPATSSSSSSSSSSVSGLRIRLLREAEEAKMLQTEFTKISFPDTKTFQRMVVEIKPAEGYYHGGSFVFEVDVPDDYPYHPPKAVCRTDIYHPNIDTEGKVCLNILRSDWKPTLALEHVVIGLQHLMVEPNPDDPLHRDAAELLSRDPAAFAEAVKRKIRYSRW